ncbi:MAG: hypothetical protein ACWGQW_03775 [bacterium]
MIEKRTVTLSRQDVQEAVFDFIKKKAPAWLTIGLKPGQLVLSGFKERKLDVSIEIKLDTEDDDEDEEELDDDEDEFDTVI